MTRRLFLAVVLAVLGGLLLAAGALGQRVAPGLTATAANTAIDSGPPPANTTIDSGPPSLSSSSTATFTFHSDNPHAKGFECSLDGAAFTNCSSPKTYNGIADGSHTFDVQEIKAPPNSTIGHAAWTIDSTPPHTTIDSGPSDPTSSTSVTFTFTSNEPGSTFECSRNLAAYTVCLSPTTYSALADGPHSFNVRAIDSAGNTDPTPVSATWTVATTSTVASTSTDAPPVDDLRAVAGDHRVRLVWKNPTGIGLRRIEVRRGSRQLLVYSGPATEFTDTRVFNDRTYTYSVVVVDDMGNRSPAAGVFARPHGKLRAPRDGARVLRAPMLRWMPRARATYYNVQLYRNGRKILSRWPARPRLQLKTQWRYQGRVYRLRDARYIWYVFPGFGTRPANRYGNVMGHLTFIKR